MKKIIACCVISVSALALYASSASAQERKGIKSTPLALKDVTGIPDKEIRIQSIEIAPGGASGIHTHPGDEHGTVIEGTLMVKVGEGEYKPVGTGETFSAPPNTPMGIWNSSDKPTKVIGVLFLDKGKPYTTPVAAPK